MLAYSSGASEPPAPGGIVTPMSSSRSATGCSPHPPRNVGPDNSGASNDPLRFGMWQDAHSRS